jgi:hypothetical protein
MLSAVLRCAARGPIAEVLKPESHRVASPFSWKRIGPLTEWVSSALDLPSDRTILSKHHTVPPSSFSSSADLSLLGIGAGRLFFQVPFWKRTGELDLSIEHILPSFCVLGCSTESTSPFSKIQELPLRRTLTVTVRDPS